MLIYALLACSEVSIQSTHKADAEAPADSDQRSLDAPRITRLERVPDPLDDVAHELVLYY